VMMWVADSRFQVEFQPSYLRPPMRKGSRADL